MSDDRPLSKTMIPPWAKTKPISSGLLVETTYYKTTAAGRKGKKLKTERTSLSTRTLNGR